MTLFYVYAALESKILIHLNRLICFLIQTKDICSVYSFTFITCFMYTNTGIVFKTSNTRSLHVAEGCTRVPTYTIYSRIPLE